MKSFAVFLKEMAVGKILYHPNVSTPALKSAKYNQQFFDVVSRHPDFPFNFIFFPGISSGAFSYKEPDQLLPEIEQFMQEHGVVSQNHITVVLGGGTKKRIKLGGADIMPMTPWTRIHRACHGIVGNTNHRSLLASEQQWAVEHMRKLGGYLLYNPRNFKFASAQNPEQFKNNQMEFLRDIMTEYIWHGGKIRTVYNNQEVVAPLEKACHDILTKFLGSKIIEGIDFL